MAKATHPVEIEIYNGKKYIKKKGHRVFHGKYVNEHFKDWQAHLFCFGIQDHGADKFKHWKAFVQMNWPEPLFMWDEWADLFFGALCGYKELIEEITGKKIEADYKWWLNVISTGAASTGKSSKAALWILGNWLCGREQTSALLTSTSLDQLQRRIWAELCEWINKSRNELPLEIVPSDTIIRYDKKDKRSAIFGIAVKSGGNPQEAVDRIKGIHNRAVFVVVDEMTAVAPAITSACSNLNKGTKRFQLLGLGNALPGDNPHTVYCEPVGGWTTTTVDDQFWLTKKGGCCVHFDGHRSPALRDPNKYHFYIKQEELDRDVRDYGGENTPEYWTNDRGYWPPSGLSNTVMDQALFSQFKVEEKALWRGIPKIGASFDPSFEGGDRRVLYPFRWGEFDNGVIGIEFREPIIVGIDSSTDVRWIHYAIADVVQNLCLNYEIDGKKSPITPENFIMDTTGEGGGLFSVMSGRWSPLINSLEFGGAAEKEQISPDRPVTYHDLYGNKVTMLYYVMRRFVEGGQVRGLSDSETRDELTGREKVMKNGKTFIRPKKEMKTIRHRSPDRGDAAVIATEFLRRQGVSPAGKTGGAQQSLAAWNKMAAQHEYDPDEGYDDADSAFA